MWHVYPVVLVASIHTFIMMLEMFRWPMVLKAVTGHGRDIAGPTLGLGVNIGLYNGFLAAGLWLSLVWGTPDQRWILQVFLLACVMVAGVVGAVTFRKPSFLVFQTLFAGLALWFVAGAVTA